MFQVDDPAATIKSNNGSTHARYRFNSEELAYGWETTTYPQRVEVVAALKPFFTLYDTANDFETKRSDWLFGVRANIQPDDVEQELGAFNRAMFKLEKGFSDCPPAHGIASKTRARVENMRERLPLIHALCNPGMRQRHWQSVSAIVGRPIEPTESTTLQAIGFTLTSKLRLRISTS